MARIKERKRADGGTTYQVTWVLGGGRPGNGAKEQAESFTTRNRADAFRLDVEHAGHQWPEGWVRGKGYVQQAPASAGPKVSELVELHWERKQRSVERGRVKRYTLQRYKRIYALHIEPTFAGMDVAAIVPEDIEDWIDQQLEAGASPKSIRNRHGLLSEILKLGALKHWTPINPCEGSELPHDDARARRHIRFFTHDEWAVFRRELNEDVHLLADYLLATGARWSEATAIRRGDCTVNKRDEVVAHIVRAWGGRADDDPDPIDWAACESHKYKLYPPKNKKARFAVVSGDVAKRAWERIEGMSPSAYIFQRKRSPWRYEDWHYERWAPAVRRAKLEKHVTPHMLRHTFAVWSIAAGVPIEKVSEALGHASIQITWDTYGGLLDLADPAAARAMAAQMAGS